MKITNWLFATAVFALPTLAFSSTYDMTFTGGVYLNLEGNVLPLAPQSGSFNYDPQSGFSNFVIQYQGESFDLTASANAPTLCNPSGQNCSSGNAASTFTLLTEQPSWYSFETYSGGAVVTELSLANSISATAPVFPGFIIGDSPRSGVFTLSGTTASDPGTPTPDPGIPTPTPDPVVPEPGVSRLLALAVLSLLCFRALCGRLGVYR